jgi:hypothetical protein
MPGLNGTFCGVTLDAIIGIRSEFPSAQIVLTTYTGEVQVLRALKAGAQGYIAQGYILKGRVRSWTPSVLSIPVKRDSPGDRRSVLHCRRHGQEPRHEYTRQAWRQRPDPCRRADARTRNYRIVDPSKVG